ncbi:AAA family ATPase [Streptomyces sp. NPDC088116]|uniref:AAA family ATPase n=1 Tax=Streptomyces sp. NPDC088116 TaxID=3365825 RepID=UPI0038289181
MATTEDQGVGKHHVGWRPEKLREMREAHGLTLEKAGERLREVAEQAKLKGIPAANPQTLWQHEQGEVYPGPHYRRAYCLLYRGTDPELGFRAALPGEDTQFKLTPMNDQSNGAHVLAVERAVHRIAPGTDTADHVGLQQRILDAWKRRHTGGDPHRPVLILVGGFAGSGKTELARFLTQLTGWPLLDKDPQTRPLVERLLVALGGDPNDRHTELYRTEVRPVEYDCLMQAAYANIRCGISTVLSAPFIAEMTDPGWMQRLTNKCGARGVDVFPMWVQCDEESMREYITFRSAARDAWKLARWDEYVETVNLELRPAVPHMVVDNRLGAAVSLADQARHAIGAVYG